MYLDALEEAADVVDRVLCRIGSETVLPLPPLLWSGPMRMSARCYTEVEAAAAGLPLIVTPQTGVGTSLIGDDQAGPTVNRSVDDFALSLLELGADSQLRMELGRKAREQAMKFSWERCAEAVMDLCYSLIRSDSGPSP